MREIQAPKHPGYGAAFWYFCAGIRKPDAVESGRRQTGLSPRKEAESEWQRQQRPQLTVAFGMVTVPVKVFSAIEDSGIKRNRYTKDGHPVGMKPYDKETGVDVEFSEIVTKYACEDGTLVELTDDEIAAAAVGASNGMATVVAMCPVECLAQYHAESLLQVRPDQGKAKKSNPIFDKTFALLMEAMKAESTFALVEFAMRGKPRYGALTSDGYLRVLAYEDEVREPRPMPQAQISAAELDMARKLVDTMKQDGYVAVADEASAKVREYAETKAKAGVVPAAEEITTPETVDLMAALSASVDAAHKAMQPQPV